ncbi:MAG: hypothetical protein Q9211_001067 [Gyalolechia sp. 1 TL-2023]
MRVPVDRTGKRGSIKPDPSAVQEAIQTATSDGLQGLPSGSSPAYASNRAPNQQPPAQQERRTTHVPCRKNGRVRKVIELYADDDECPVKWHIQTIPSLAPVRKRLLDEVTPLLTRLIQQCSGSVCSAVVSNSTNSFPGATAAVNHQGGKGSLLASGAGYGLDFFDDKKKRGHPHASDPSGKRLKPCSTYEMEMSTSPVRIALAGADAEGSSNDWADGLGNGDSDSDEDRKVVIEEATEALRLDDRERIGEYYRRTFTIIGQMLLKCVMKAWIKVKEPGKQVKHPYNGGSNPSDDPQNRGRDTAPDWWSQQSNWKIGLGCRHREPDHLGKLERLFYAPILLRQTSSFGKGEFTVQRLRDATDLIAMSPEQSKVLREMYDVREQEQRFEERETGGEVMIYVSKSTSLPLKRKSKKSKKKKGKGTIKRAPDSVNVKEKGNDPQPAQWSSEPLTPTATPTRAPSPTPTPTEIEYSPFNLDFTPAAVKIEYGSHNAEYASGVQAPLAQCDLTHMKDEVFESIMPATSAKLNGISAPPSELQGNEESLTELNLGCHYASLGPDDGPMAEAAPPFVPVSGPTSRLAIRNRHMPYRRAASVQRYESPSYTQAWPPRTDQYNFLDNTPFDRFRMPRASIGMPSSGLEIPIDAKNNHAHGLPPHIQQPLCASHHCPNGHTHGWRPEDEQQEICSRNRCHLDPRSHPLVFGRPAEPLHSSHDQNWDTGFDTFLAPGGQDFDVHKSFP